MKPLLLAGCLCAASTAWSGVLQDPTRAATVAGYPMHHQLEGVYELRSRTVAGVTTPNRSRGYVAITRRHMLLCLVAEGPDPGQPLLRAGVRGWEAGKDEQIATEVRFGFFTDESGTIHVDQVGQREIKKLELSRGRLRIWQDPRSYLDFERIE